MIGHTRQPPTGARMQRIAFRALVTYGLAPLACAATIQKAAEPRDVAVGAERATEATGAAPPHPRAPSDVELCGDGNYEACIRLYERKGDKRPIIEQVVTYFATAAGVADAAGALPLEACASGDGHACAVVAAALEDAHADDSQSRRFHRLACVQGHWFSCNNLHLAHDKVGSYVLAQSYMEACDRAKDREACLSAAVVLKGVDDAKEIVYLKKTCDLGSAMACYDYAHAARLFESDPAAFVALIKKSCRDHNAFACDLVGFSTARHVRFCREGDPVACAFVPGHAVDGGAPSPR